MQEHTVHVLILMLVVVLVFVLVAVAVIMVVSFVEEEQSDEVDEEAQDRDQQQALGLDELRLVDALDALAEDVEGDEHQEYAVEQPTLCLYFAVSIRVLLVCAEFGDVGGAEPDEQSHAVEEHVEGVGDQAETVGDVAVGQLHEHEQEVDGEEYRDLPRVVVLHARLHEVVHQRIFPERRDAVFTGEYREMLKSDCLFEVFIVKVAVAHEKGQVQEEHEGGQLDEHKHCKTNEHHWQVNSTTHKYIIFEILFSHLKFIFISNER